MKKIIISLAVLSAVVSCKKEESYNATLDALIKNKDVKGLQAYMEKERVRVDSINNVMSNIDAQLKKMGAASEMAGIVSVQKLQQTSFMHNVEIQGNVTTDQNIKIMPQFSGILSLYVREGQYVKAGQVIGKVSDGGLNDQYKQAQIQVAAMNAQLQQVKSQANLMKIAYEKQAALWKQKIGSEFQYLQAKTSYESAQKQIMAAQSQVAATQKAADAIRATLAKTTITAPFGGVIDEVITQNGQVVAPNSEIVKLISLGVMRVEAKVPEIYLAKVKRGSAVDVHFPTINKSVKSSVKLVGNFIDPATRTFLIQVPVPNVDGIIKPNLLAQLKIQDYVNPSALQIPSQYIYQDANGENYIFEAVNIQGNNAIAKKVLVKLGEKSGNNNEIVSGVIAGKFIIMDGSKNLIDGQKVKIYQ